MKVDGKSFTVEVGPAGEVTSAEASESDEESGSSASGDGEPVTAPLAGNVFKILVKPGQEVAEGDVLIIVEAMKMETDIKADRAGVVAQVHAREGDSVAVGDVLIELE